MARKKAADEQVAAGKSSSKGGKKTGKAVDKAVDKGKEVCA